MSTLMGARKGLSTLGAWTPSMSGPLSVPLGIPGGRDGRLVKKGPTNLDVDAQRTLQAVLKPCHYNIIGPWIDNASEVSKNDVLKLANVLRESDAELADQRTGYIAACDSLTQNPHGRVRLTKLAPVTADRLQHDLWRNRHKTDQADTELQARRKFHVGYADIPSVGTVSDYHSLNDISLRNAQVTKVLAEGVRSQLHRCQTRTLERDKVAAAQVMRALRSISEAVTALPSYKEFSKTGSFEPHASSRMFEFAKSAPRGSRRFRHGMVPGKLRMSHSAPILMPPSPLVVSPEEIENIPKPGGDVVHFFDQTPLQTLKNKQRATRSKIALVGGNADWTTSYERMHGPRSA